jgi:hypothetical protein
VKHASFAIVVAVLLTVELPASARAETESDRGYGLPVSRILVGKGRRAPHVVDEVTAHHIRHIRPVIVAAAVSS